MRSGPRIILPLLLLFVGGGAILFPVDACAAPQTGAEATKDGTSGATGSLEDKPLAPFQTDLLDLAFNSASAFPLDPHIKNRSRAQEAVVAACLDLDQPRRALRYIEEIENWRRGTCYADVAFYCARHGHAAEVKRCLNLARRISENVSESAEDAGSQDWRRDRIRVRIAKTYLWLGQKEEAARFEAGLVESEAGKAGIVRAMLLDTETFDEYIKALDAVFAAGHFDLVQNALKTCAQLFNRFYDDKDRRLQVEERMRTAWEKLPIMVRIELTMELAGYALGYEDQEKALELVKEAQLLVEDARWRPEHHVPMKARLAELLYRAGDEDAARSKADAALAMFDAKRDKIVSMYRAGALRPLAEAYNSMGDRLAALRAYKKAVEEGVENPNSRPRALDLSATCCSMALHGVEPDAELWARIRRIQDELGKPW